MGVPERYAGDQENCNLFITNCSILFALQPYNFASEVAKVAFRIINLTGCTRLWVTAEWEHHVPACSSFNAFATELCTVRCSIQRSQRFWGSSGSRTGILFCDCLHH